ncbi:MAG: [protein-PII] uridylyltransferase [Alphaproteobacteria bacterium]|nr:[protein-PII] uridylyltransferase [Alphaproteobacteria bacterium]
MTSILAELPPAPAVNVEAFLPTLEASLDVVDPRDSGALLEASRTWLNGHQQALEQRFLASGNGEAVIYDRCRLIDALITGLLGLATKRLYRLPNPTEGERLALLAVGGYGRAELAPHSDVDLLFLHPYKITPHTEKIVEFLLYKLWDLGLKVGQATRSIDECIRLAQDDSAVLTSLLEARFLFGDQALMTELNERFDREVRGSKTIGFVEAKLKERDDRHQRTGDSRYMLEPNVKEGKGGLRDLHTLFWLGRFLYRIDDVDDFVRHEVLTEKALEKFLRARRFLWAVRCHLHYLTGRAEERLTYDVQPAIAERMGYRDRKSAIAVERFMKHYYLYAKEVGALTLIFCAALEEKHRQRFRFRLDRFGFGRRRVDDMVIQAGRIAPVSDDLFERDPVAMLRLFHLAQERQVNIHPEALRAVTQNLYRISREVRGNAEANQLFLAILTSTNDPAKTLRRMNEAGLLGRFIPEFGRVVALMEHSLYHTYTVDEHTIQAIGILHQIEAGELGEELPLSTGLIPHVLSRTELYLALFFHDLGKGRDRHHCDVGAELVMQAGPRLGLNEDQIETIAWLVRHHLLFSTTAFRRDLDDPKTVADFASVIQSPERLRLLLLLTAADIRAVGPNVWNGWKGQLLRTLYQETLAVLEGAEVGPLRQARVDAAKEAFREACAAWPEDRMAAYLERHDPRYWTSFDTPAHLRHAKILEEAEQRDPPFALDFYIDRFRARTELVVCAADHPGLFMKIAGALALAGSSIVDARITTTADGLALDSFGIQNVEERTAVDDERKLARIRKQVDKALAGEIWPDNLLAKRKSLPARTEVFEVEPRALINNQASRTHTVLEVNGRDRPGLLYDVTKALKDLGLVISSAHIATYGERVVDVFYVKDVFGLKIRQPSKIRQVQRHLVRALTEGERGARSKTKVVRKTGEKR